MIRPGHCKLAIAAVEKDKTNELANSVLNDLLLRSGKTPSYQTVLSKHGAPIADLDISSDVQTIVAGDTEGMIYVWSFDGDSYNRFEGHDGAINDVDMLSGDNHLATASEDKTCKIWSLDGGLETVFRHPVPVNDIKLLKKNRGMALTAAQDGKARLFDRSTGDLVRVIDAQAGEITSMELINNEQYLITAGPTGEIIITDLNSGKHLRRFEGDGVSINNMDYHKKDKLLAVGYNDGRLKIFHFDGITMEDRLSFKPHENAIHDLVLKDYYHQPVILTSSEDNTAKMWDINGNLLKTFLGHQNGLRAISLEHPEGSDPFIVSGGQDKTIKVYSMAPNENWNRTINEAASAISISQIGDKLIAVGNRALYYAAEDSLAAIPYAIQNIPSLLLEHDTTVVAVSIAENGILLTADLNGVIYQWDLQGNQIGQLEEIKTDGCNSIVFSPDGKYIWVKSPNNSLQIWTTEGKPYAEPVVLDPEAYKINKFAFSAEGNYVLVSDSSSTYLFSKAGALLSTLDDHQEEVISLSFSPEKEATYFATGSKDKSFNLYRIPANQSIELVKKFKNHNADVNKVTFSMDGRAILSACADGSLKLWDIRGQQLSSFIRHHGAILDAVFSTNEKEEVILTSSADGTVKLWEPGKIGALLENIEPLATEEKEEYFSKK